MTARIIFDRREIVIVTPRSMPDTKDSRAALHRELDDALDELLAHDKRAPEPEGPGRIADDEEAA